MEVTLAPQDEPFDFFRMPRELRDKVYGNISCAITIHEGGLGGPHVLIRGTPRRKLKLLNKQFKESYEKHMRETATLVLRDSLAPSTLEFVALGTLTRSLRNLEVDLHDITTYRKANVLAASLQEVRQHRRWAAAIVEFMSQIRRSECNYYLHTEHNSRREVCWVAWLDPAFRRELDELCVDLALTSLRVYALNHEVPVALRDRKKELRSTWTKSGGWEGLHA